MPPSLTTHRAKRTKPIHSEGDVKWVVTFADPSPEAERVLDEVMDILMR